MLKCDRCGKLLALIKVHKNKFYCDNCKAWLGYASQAEISDCIDCSVEHAKHSKG
ncbi:hypothetical protein HYU18_05005 [Candidatus Woesearchaeota archaeon]|nr:hypothetical protein [Candidatus Woesearchaeota archaeon]